MIVASANRNKLAEFCLLLGEQFGPVHAAPESLCVSEDAPDFAGNARKKVVALAALLRQQGVGRDDVLLADDSGLCVDALGGRPGVRSARLGSDEAARLGEQAPVDQDAGCRTALLRLLEGVPDDRRTAQLCCALVLWLPDEDEPRVYEGVLGGHIAPAPRGSSGFGYDPLFVPHGQHKTLAELGMAYKNQISHRRRAVAALLADAIEANKMATHPKSH